MRGTLWLGLVSAALSLACSSSSTHPATGGAAGAGGATGGTAGTGGTGTGGALGGAAGGGGTAGGGGGTGAVSGSGGGDGGLACPPLKGPKLVGAYGYCIDETEVTNADYLEFVEDVADAGVPSQPSACKGNTSVAPNTTSTGCPSNPSGDPADLPIRCIDWCDAYAYCKWAGKRLCGSRLNGGGIPVTDYATPSVSQWFAACSDQGADDFPYGTTYESSRCVDAAVGVSEPLAVGGKPTCKGFGVPALDMSGNVAEWEDGCSGDSCLIRGGSFNESDQGVSCAGNAGGDFHPRLQVSPAIGFRCCWSPP